MTGNRKIIWNDPNSFFLGYGTADNRGENKLGELLDKIREDIKRENITEKTIDVNSISNFIINDEFMYNWALMRMKDMCNTVFKMKKYLKTSAKQDETIDPKFIDIIINNIYKPLSSNIPLIETDIITPDIFISDVLRCKGLIE